MAKVEAMPEIRKLSDYVGVMQKLEERGMTLRAIADFMSTELGQRVSYTRVFRLLRDATKLPNEEPSYGDYEEDQLAKRAELREQLEKEDEQ